MTFILDDHECTHDEWDRIREVVLDECECTGPFRINIETGRTECSKCTAFQAAVDIMNAKGTIEEISERLKVKRRVVRLLRSDLTGL